MDWRIATVRRRLVVNFIWSSPRFESAPAVARRVLADWRFSRIALFQSGGALSVFDSNAGNVYGLLSSRDESSTGSWRGRLRPAGLYFPESLGMGDISMRVRL